MHLDDLAYITESEVEVLYIHRQRRFTARLKGADVIDGTILSPSEGVGTTAEMAQRDYAKNIRGKRIAFDAYSSSRREYNVPESLSA